MKRSFFARYGWSIVIIGVIAAVGWVVPSETLRSWTPYLALIYAAVLYAHFETKFDNLSMDLEAVEAALDRIDPEHGHTELRFRFKNR